MFSLNLSKNNNNELSLILKNKKERHYGEFFGFFGQNWTKIEHVLLLDPLDMYIVI